MYALVLAAILAVSPMRSHPAPVDVPMIYTFDEAGWRAYPPTSQIGSAYGYHSPSKALHLAGNGLTSMPDGANIDTPWISVGQTYYMTAWVNGDGASLDTPLKIAMAVPNYKTHEFTIDSSTLAPGWQQVFVGVFVGWHDPFFADSQRLLYVSMDNGVGGAIASGEWLIDDIEIGGQEMKKWTGISAAIAAMKTITTAGNYNNDLGSRVYTRLFTPQEQRDVKLPYACLPVDQEAEKIEYEGFQFQSTWRLTGHAFFDDNSESDPLNSTGATAAAKFRDDLIRAFMADPDLANTVNNCEVTNIETSAGIVDDGVSEVIFTIEFMQYGGAADLAAS